LKKRNSKTLPAATNSPAIKKIRKFFLPPSVAMVSGRNTLDGVMNREGTDGGKRYYCGAWSRW
jgi:hypothetical protein